MTEYERGYREIRETAACLAERASEECDEATAVHLRGVAHDIRCMPVPRIPPAPDDEALVDKAACAIAAAGPCGPVSVQRCREESMVCRCYEDARAVLTALREAGALRHE